MPNSIPLRISFFEWEGFLRKRFNKQPACNNPITKAPTRFSGRFGPMNAVIVPMNGRFARFKKTANFF
jgi:hypothetical protein